MSRSPFKTRLIQTAAALALCAGAAMPASATPTLQQINLGDGNGGGWTTSSNPGIFRLFVINSSNPFGAFANPGTNQTINIGLTDGTFDFTCSATATRARRRPSMPG